MSQGSRAFEETTPYFENEYEVELERWVRRRFRNLCIGLLAILIGVWGFVLAMQLLGFLASSDGDIPRMQAEFQVPLYGIVQSFLLSSIVLWFLIKIRPKLETKNQLIRAATQLIILLSLIDVFGHICLNFLGYATGMFNIMELFYWHVIACLFLPWTPWQSLKAIGPAFLLWNGGMIANALTELVVDGASLQKMLLTTALLLLLSASISIIFLPGVLLCWWRLRRHGRRFKTEMLGRHFLSMRRELKQARRIHDALFPEPSTDDQCRFDFEYTPHTDIGGDFVFFERTDSNVRVILIDVTGHGLTAAMTVNRIHGELQRIRGEHPMGDPALVMSLLDRYFVLTLAPHNVFATSLVFDLDLSTGVLKWVNAGHPPAFVITHEGDLRELDTTTIMLGAMGPNDFEPEQEEMRISPGDSIVAYTDGVIEARNAKGEMLGLDRLRQLVRTSNDRTSWPRRIRDIVHTHSRGAFEDDVLVVELDYLAAASPAKTTTEPKPTGKETAHA